jgi:hypothetical protein
MEWVDDIDVAPDDLVQIFTALCGGGGLWLAVREVAKQVGETRRERIRQKAFEGSTPPQRRMAASPIDR